MKKLFYCIIISLNFFNCKLFAQNIDFNEKKVGIIISRKNLQIDSYHSKFWASYLQINDSLGLTEENLKTAVTIKLGQLLIHWFSLYLKATEVHFLNEGKKFENLVKSYPFKDKPDTPIPLDYIFCIDQLFLYSIKEKVVLTLSNKLFTEYQTKLKIEGKVIIYQLEPYKIIEDKIYKSYENTLKSQPIKIEELSYKIEKILGSWLNQIF